MLRIGEPIQKDTRYYYRPSIYGIILVGKRILLTEQNGKEIQLQGPNSTKLKFEKVMCEKCNNTTSQPFDRAYDKFISYVLNNYELLSKKGTSLSNKALGGLFGFLLLNRYINTKIQIAKSKTRGVSIINLFIFLILL